MREPIRDLRRMAAVRLAVVCLLLSVLTLPSAGPAFAAGGTAAAGTSAGGSAAPSSSTAATTAPTVATTTPTVATTTPTVATSTPTTPPATPATPGATSTPAPTTTIGGTTVPSSQVLGTLTLTKKSGGGKLSGAAILAAILAGLIALACLAWAIFRLGAFEPHWLLTARHSVAEAGFRASATWDEFTDWLRLGH